MSARKKLTESVQVCDCAPDCKERISCPESGRVGHWQCGWCGEHDRARHLCGCLVISSDSAATS